MIELYLSSCACGKMAVEKAAQKFGHTKIECPGCRREAVGLTSFEVICMWNAAMRDLRKGGKE